MTAIQYSDVTTSIRYALSSAPRRGGIAIMLDLYRGSVPLSTTTIAEVAEREAGPVLIRCRRHLERLGVHAVADATLDIGAERPEDRRADPRQALSVAAFDWVFEAV